MSLAQTDDVADNATSGGNSRAVTRSVILVVGIVLLSFADVIVLERIYHPIHREQGVPWEVFEISSPLGNGKMLWWHVALAALGWGLFILCGIASRDWRLAAAGIVLLASGWEDLTYYLLQGKWLPGELPWLDPAPTLSWTRLLTRSPHVTRSGLYVSMLTGLAFSLWLLGVLPFRRRTTRSREKPSQKRAISGLGRVAEAETAGSES